MRAVQGKTGYALGAALMMAMMSGTASAATQVFAGLDNSFLAGGGAHPSADAARSDFEAAAGVLLLQTFDELPTGNAPASLIVPFGASLTATATGYVNIAETRGGFDTFPSSGKFLDALSANGSIYFTFGFNIPTRAFGFDISDANDWFGDLRPTTNLVVTLLTRSGSLDLQLFAGTNPNGIVNGNFGFFGVVSDAQDLLGFSIRNPLANPDADAIGIDNLSVSIEPVPLPGAAWLMLSALGGAAGLVRRHRPAAS